MKQDQLAKRVPSVWTTLLHIKSSFLSQSQGEAENASYPTHQYFPLDVSL